MPISCSNAVSTPWRSARHSCSINSRQWQANSLWISSLDRGLQELGNVGEWYDWDPANRQSHRMGSAIPGKQPLGSRHAIEYNAAC